MNVFINCPFDEEYELLFYAIVFTVMSCQFNPRCALEKQDSSQTRFDKIKKIIKECQYSIHDISRVQLDKKNKLPRFNMPFELGLFLGAKEYGGKTHKNKSCIVLETQKYQSQKFMSDLAGQDIEHHSDNPKEVIKAVRNYLNNHTKLPGATHIKEDYNKFQRTMPEICKKLKLDHKKLEYNDFKAVVKTWLEISDSL